MVIIKMFKHIKKCDHIVGMQRNLCGGKRVLHHSKRCNPLFCKSNCLACRFNAGDAVSRVEKCLRVDSGPHAHIKQERSPLNVPRKRREDNRPSPHEPPMAPFAQLNRNRLLLL
jgi:hypothetical protein